MVDLLASRMSEGDFAALFDISVLLDDSALFAAWARRARSLQKSDESARGFLAACLARGHPTRLREAMLVFEAAGFKEAEEARAQLPQVASAYLAARLAEGDMTRLHEAISEAEAEGIEQVSEARAQLPRLVHTDCPLKMLHEPFLVPHRWTMCLRRAISARRSRPWKRWRPRDSKQPTRETNSRE